jgi:uncharacterized protein (TIGR02646 family)
MILINKKAPSQSLQGYFAHILSSKVWKNALANTQIDMRDLFDNAEREWNISGFKDKIRSELFSQQNGLCAYCMSKLSLASTPPMVKIEHYHPLSITKYRGKTFSFDNYLLVCTGGSKCDDDDRKTCDTRKGNIEITIDPTNRIHMSHIIYRKNGIITYSDSSNPQVEEKIIKDLNDTLNLNGITDESHELCLLDNATELVAGRRKAYERANEEIEKLRQNNKLTEQAIKKLIIKYEKMHVEFEGVFIYVFNLRLKTATHNHSRRRLTV